MISKMVEENRLYRARKMSDRSLVEFKILNEKPLQVYCKIRGTTSEPYIVFIDLKKKLVGHNCADFAKGNGWCKHLGRLLLSLDDKQLQRVYNDFYKIKSLTHLQQIEDHLDEMKKRKSSTKHEPYTISYAVNTILAQFKDNESVSSKIKKIKLKLKNEFKNTTKNQLLPKLTSLIESLPYSKVNSFIEYCRPTLLEILTTILSNFFDDFWIVPIKQKLEQAYEIQQIAKMLKLALELPRIVFPKTVSREDKNNLIIVLKLLHEEEDALLFEQFRKYQLLYSEKEINKRAKRILYSIKLSSTNVPEIEQWLETQIGCKISSVSISHNKVDFLIYLMKCAGESFDSSDFYSSYNSETCKIKKNILENNPCLNFIIEHMKESEREYLTISEKDQYTKFFEWLTGAITNSNWIEKPRVRAIESSLDPQGFILQWDINLSSKQKEFLQAFDGSKRLLIDPSSPLKSSIQPFDYTYCTFKMREGKNGDYYINPQQILLPNQVVKLANKGFKVVSNILPWSILSDFANKGYLLGGDIAKGINTCDNLKFVYGSLNLKTSFAKLEKLYRTGLTEKQFLKLKGKIGFYNTLNPEVKEYCRDVLFSEGQPLKELFSFFKIPENIQNEIIMQTVFKSSSLEEFRTNVSLDIIDYYFMNMELERNIFNEISKLDLGHYYPIGEIIAIQLRIYHTRLEFLLVQNTQNADIIMENPIGKLFLKELKYNVTGKLEPEQRFKLYRHLIKTMFIFGRKVKEELWSEHTPSMKLEKIKEFSKNMLSINQVERLQSLVSLSLLDHPSVNRELKIALRSYNPEVRNMAFIALMARKTRGLAAYLFKIINNENEVIGINTIKLLTKLKEPKVFQYIALSSDNDNSMVRRLALEKMIEYSQKHSIFEKEKTYIIHTLAEKLLDDNPDVRHFAVKQLLVISDKLIIEHLIDALDNPDGFIRDKAIREIEIKGTDSQIIRAFLKQARDSDTQLRFYALSKLIRDKNPNVKLILKDTLTNSGEKMRGFAMEFLLNNPLPDVSYTKFIIKEMVDDLVNNNKMFSWSEIKVFNNIGAKCVPLLEKIFDNEDYGWKETVVKLLETINTKSSLEAITSLSYHSDSSLRILALKTLNRLKPIQSKKFALELLKDESKDIQLAACFVLQSPPLILDIFNETTLKSFVDIYTYNNMTLTDGTYNLLVRLKHRAIPHLENILRSKSEKTKESAIRILIEHDTEKARKILIKQYSNKNPGIRAPIFSYFFGLNHPQSPEIINKALLDKDDQFREKVLDFLLSSNIDLDIYLKNFLAAISDIKFKTHSTLSSRIVYVLARIDENKIIPHLEKLIENPNSKNRLLLLEALFDMKSEHAEELIINLRKHKNKEVRSFVRNKLKIYKKKKESMKRRIYL
ncbi:MAG: HEAT repeat domain-containing protein [Candidatus Heimdallarchaeaceae archaeon]